MAEIGGDGLTTSESIIEELKREHGVNSIAVPCPGCHPMKLETCPYCHGCGKIQYGIDDLEVFS